MNKRRRRKVRQLESDLKTTQEHEVDRIMVSLPPTVCINIKTIYRGGNQLQAVFIAFHWFTLLLFVSSRAAVDEAALAPSLWLAAGSKQKYKLIKINKMWLKSVSAAGSQRRDKDLTQYSFSESFQNKPADDWLIFSCPSWWWLHLLTGNVNINK